MCRKATSGRDAFTFSLAGMTTIASFTAAPAIDQHRVNRAIAERQGETPEDQPDTAREIEDFLARYFAPAEVRRAA